ncbi:ROK family protein [Actinokineospora guangxiensis]|uniref:ROK family protein n=1 Tax=Actinokineospora guangxiensis TaxID=1490288 RepID=A0ABW0ETZ6_9PSEU
MTQQAGSSRMLRELNEAAALGHLLESGPLTRGDLCGLTGLARPTISDVVRRLQDAGLARIVGRTSGGRGPNADIYAVNPNAAYGVAVSLRAQDSTMAAAVCDLDGEVRAQVELPVEGVDPVDAVAAAVAAAAKQARVAVRRVEHVRLAVPGSYHENAEVIRYVDVPGWSRPGLVGEIRARLRTDLAVDNDVNLAAVAERAHGIAADADGFALLWLGEEGLGLAIDLGGTLLRGARGGAGEIGYMPVGLPSAERIDFHDLVSGEAIRALAAEHGIVADTGHLAVAAAAEAGRSGCAAFIDALAVRIAVGLAAVIAVLDPPLVVLAGEVGQAGGAVLHTAVGAALREISVLETTVASTALTDDPVLRGAIDTTLAAVREAVLDRG